MEKLLRDWRQDAINKHQYESAVYIGDKLLALTSEAACPLILSLLLVPRLR
jgi:hypothetical protein